MIDMIFPAQKIPKGCRLVIWGANIAGECFYEQITSLKHASVITFIDSRMKNNHLKLNINRPEWLKNNQDSYDYILIGSIRQNVRDEIKKILFNEYNVPENKIVCDGYMICMRNSGIADYDSADEIVDILENFGRSNVFVYEPIQYIIETAAKNDKILKAIKELFSRTVFLKTKLACAYILLQINSWNSIIFEDIMKTLKKCVSSKPIWAYYFLSEVVQDCVMRFPEYRYYNFYKDRKEIMSDISKAIYTKKKKKGPVRKGRIVIASAAPLVGEHWHITKVIAQVAIGLKRRGYEIAVFAESKVYSQEDIFINTCHVNTKGVSVYAESNQRAFGESIPIYYSEGESTIEHANDYVDKIIQYNPECIIYFTADYTCATKVLYELFPIVSLPSVVFGVSAFFHCIAYSDISLLLWLNDKYPWIEEGQELMEILPWTFHSENKNVYRREDKGWKKDDFIAVTVGNRLKYDLKNEFVDAVCHEIENNEVLKWVIVGSSSINYIDVNYSELLESKRIIYINYENDLMALYKILDVYLNPIRNGGGISIAWAMRVGIPIVTLDSITDGVSWLGRENAVKGDYNNLIYELRKLISNKEYYKYKSRRMIEQAKKWDYDLCIDRIIEISNRAIEIFNEKN